MIPIYWIIFLSISFFCLFDGRSIYRKFCYRVFCAYSVVLILFSTFKDINQVPDAKTYVSALEDREIILEPTFNIIKDIINIFFDGNYIFLFLIYACLAVFIKVKAIPNISFLPLFSLLIWFSDLYPLQELAQMRASVAGSFFLLSIPSLYNRDFKLYLFWTICAILFHFSALIMLILWFLSTDRFNKAFWIFLVILSFGWALLQIDIIGLITLLPIEGIEEKYNAYILLQGSIEDPQIFSPLVLGKLIVIVIIVYKINIISNYNKYIFLMSKIMLLSIIIYSLFSSNIAIAFRLSEFMSVIEIAFIPCIYYVIKQNWGKYISIVSIALVFSCIRIFSNHLIGK